MKLISAQEVAKVLGVNQTTVRMNAKNGKYPFRYIRVGSLWKFPEDEVMQFLYGDNWKEKVPNEDSQCSATCPDEVPEQVAGSESAD